ncbi:MAG: methyl-accepting chemotaxis protein, partial [Pseudomonadota bacterium]|nr:methyl-accepting chemotaxis protein [Pseudomonadota bacterium]
MFQVVSRLSIRGRITLIAATLLSLLIASSLMAVISMYLIGNELKSITKEDIPLTSALTQVTIHQLEQAVHFERAVRFSSRQDNSSATERLRKEEVDKFHKLSALVEDEISDAQRMIQAILSVPHSDAHEAEFRDIAAGLKDVSALHKTYEEHAQAALRDLANGNHDAADRMAVKIIQEENELDKKLSGLVLKIEEFTERAAITATEHEATAERNQILLFVFSVIVSVVICHLVAKETQGHLNRVGKKLSAIAEGDLTGTVEGDDEINNPLRDMQIHLVEIIHTIQSAADKLGATVADVSATSYQTMNNIVEQQTQTESVASATAQMNATSQEVSQNIGATAAAANEANLQASSGQKV